MTTTIANQPKGVLNLKAGQQKFRLDMLPPAPELAAFIEYYWLVNWDLRGQEPHRQENLPHPCVHLVIERGQARVHGVITGKFSYLLQGSGQVFGVKFRPGAFYPWVKTPVARLTNAATTLQDVWNVDAGPLETANMTLPDDNAMAAVMNDFLRARLPQADETVTTIGAIVERVIADRTITKVDELADKVGLSKRGLQRLFNQYVGVSPKWVIQRYRLMEAADQLAESRVVDWPKLALSLGYFDQAHFIKDFKALVGSTPAEYARSLETSS